MAESEWDLSALYGGFDDPRWRADFAAAKEVARAALLHVKGLAPESFDALTAEAALRRIDAAFTLHARTTAYARMAGMADNRREDAHAMLTALDGTGTDLAAAVSALARLIQRSGRAEELANAPALKPYAAYFRLQAEAARHALPEAVEDVALRMQKTGGQSWSRLRDAADASMTACVELDGKAQTLPMTRVRAGFADPDTAVRDRCLAADIEAGRGAGTVFAACLNGIKGEALEMARLRGFGGALDWMLSISRMERETLDAMQEAIEGALPAFRRFLWAKARLLGRADGLSYCDISAPVDRAGRFTLSEARDFLAEAFSGADAELAAFADAAFEKNWIDAMPRAGKQGGGICFPLDAANGSRILLNFDGCFSGVASLAHELGHAWHDRQMFLLPPLLRDAPTPVCETASTFNETLVFAHALKYAAGGARLFYLNAALSGAVQTIVDTHSRFLFEDEVFRRRAAGPLTADALTGIMERSQRTVYGDCLGKPHPYMWVGKVHYYIPDFHYYNFPYAFGLLFARGLYAAYRRRPAAFFARYNRLLRETCTLRVEEAGRNMGIGLTKPGFWREALADFEEMADEFERLAGRNIQ